MPDGTILNPGVGGQELPSYYEVATTWNWPGGITAYLSTIATDNNVVAPVTLTDGLPVQPMTGSSWAVTGPLTDAQLRATAVPVSLTSTTITGTVAATQSGSWTVDVSGSVAVTGTFWQATQPVSGPLTDAELRATAVPVSLTSTTITGTVAATQSGTWNIGTLTSITNPVTVTGTVTANAGTNLNTSALALESGGNLASAATSLTSIDGKTPALGQALAAGSVPVVLTAAQISTLTPLATVAVTQSTSPWVVSLTSTTITGTVAVTQSGTWNITNVSGTVSLPTGASTEATLSTLNGKVTACNTGAVTISAALPAGSNSIGSIATVGGVTVSNGGIITGAGSSAPGISIIGHDGVGSFAPWLINTDGAGLVVVDGGSINIAAGSAIIGKVGIDQTTPGTTNAIQTIPGTSGGLSIYRNFQTSGAVIAAAIKASAGQLYSIECYNINAAAVYIRLYNMTTTPGTGDTVVWSGIIPGNTAGAGFVKSWPNGMAFSTGIGVRITAAIADNDNTALSANTVMFNAEYK